MKEKGYLLLSEERKINTERDYLIRVKVELWKLPLPQPTEFPQGYKFKLIAYNIENSEELVRIDNHQGKFPHYHLDNKQKSFTWVSLAETERLFLQLVQEKFGSFPWEFNLKITSKIMKKYIFKYDPYASVKEIFDHVEETVATSKKFIQPKNISIVNQFSVINRILSKVRLELFSMIREKQPNNIHELAQLLQRDYANVWRDCQVLANCEIIELQKQDKETKPIALYDQIVIEFPLMNINKQKDRTSLLV